MMAVRSAPDHAERQVQLGGCVETQRSSHEGARSWVHTPMVRRIVASWRAPPLSGANSARATPEAHWTKSSRQEKYALEASGGIRTAQRRGSGVVRPAHPDRRASQLGAGPKPPMGLSCRRSAAAPVTGTPRRVRVLGTTPPDRWCRRPHQVHPNSDPRDSVGSVSRLRAHAKAPRSRSTVMSTPPPSRTRTQWRLPTSAYQTAPSTSRQSRPDDRPASRPRRGGR